MRFVDFPTDILLYLLGYLELDDALILLSTCTRLRRLSDNRSLWITILQRIQANGPRPLACPIQQDFSQLSLSDLQKIAHRTVRLEKNWSRENPRIIGAVSTTQCEGVDGPLCILAVIPGTDILVIHSNGQLFCYDLPVATSSTLRIGDLHCYAQFDERGKQFIGVVHEIELDHHLDIFHVEYGPGTLPILRRVYHKVNPAAHMRFCRDMFMNDAIVGMISSNSASNHLCLLAINIHTSASLTVPLSGLPDKFRPSFDPFSCLMQGSYVYIGVQTNSCTCHLLRCDISTPWDTDNNHTVTNIRLSPLVTIGSWIPRRRRHQRFQATPCQLLLPIGLTALYTDRYLTSIKTTVLFQPDVFTSFGQTPDVLRLDLPGDLHTPHPYSFSTDSGNYLLLCTEPKYNDEIEDIDPQPEFYLVHFVKGPPASIAARQLTMPDFIEEELVHNRIESMLVDDHIGVVYLTREGGYISAVPFS